MIVVDDAGDQDAERNHPLAGRWISCPMSEVISNPEKAKHIADHRPMVSSASPCGTMVRPKTASPSRIGEGESAAANQESRRNPQSERAGVLQPLAEAQPDDVDPRGDPDPGQHEQTAYQRDVASHAQRSPPMAARFAAPKSRTEGK